MKHLLEVTDEVPEGHKTAIQWADEWNLSERQSQDIIKRLLHRGFAGRAVYRIKNGGCVRPVPHYYEINNDTPAAQEPVRKSRKAHGKGCPARRKGQSVRRRNT